MIDKLNKQQAIQLLNLLWKDLFAGKSFHYKTIFDLRQCNDIVIKRLTTKGLKELDKSDGLKEEERGYYADSWNPDLLKNIIYTQNHPIHNILKDSDWPVLPSKDDVARLKNLQNHYQYILEEQQKTFIEYAKKEKLPNDITDLIGSFTYKDVKNSLLFHPFFTYQEPQETGAGQEDEEKLDAKGNPAPLPAIPKY